ncbi:MULTISPECIES: alpha/beta hydrolase family protein [Roseobacteraceae]|uniref:Platelet-activating factor acetylhydrolase, isoform II n=1 Tax=Pseudosulfitobacter pseudonitzschiae TaxID=1402135 RepID=A0A221JXP0_9RHOB|nr:MULTISPECIES: dienelactone hydrolase [Roseobacteraceae]ASM71521.1 platelet-activating factor acetylhydrolase, isoform II [Pseudosulfitobacter pseudonitzschiae]
MTTTLKSVTLGLVGIGAAGMLYANPIDQIRPDAPELAPYGDYVIGVQTLEFSHAGQVDILNTTADNAPEYDRPLTVEVWYPAADGTEAGGEYTTTLRDGTRQATLTGRAARDAAPAADAQFPLIVISHGYPGNRFLMSHLGENLASKGYVTVSIDHTDSTYSDQGAFGSTLLNRPVDQRFVIEQMAALDGPLGAIIDGETVGVIGYSMGGYGAMIFGGAGVTQASTEYSWGTPNGLLAAHLAGSETHEALIDERVKAVIAIGPWGNNAGFWDAEGLAGFRKPLLLMAGGVDDVSVYDAIRGIFDGTVGTDRHLLTFDDANHNAAAPMPAPKESWAMDEGLGYAPFAHYADAVWDTNRMNNIAQHFATAFMDVHLKGEVDKATFFDLTPVSGDGVVALDDAGKPTDDHSYWNGFAPRTAAGLRFETKAKGE